MGKGSNAIVSMLHHYFALGVYLHSENCAIMVQYLLPDDWSPHGNHTVLHGGRSHHVQPGLVFWPVEEAAQENEGGLPLRPGSSSERV